MSILGVAQCDTDGLVCYQCDKVAHGRDCNHLAKCGPHEVCSNQRYITQDGHIYYKSGCVAKAFCPPSTGRKRSDFSDCTECCTQDYCNKDLCDYPKVTELENRCLECDDVESPSMCRDVVRCGTDQICYADQRYDLGFQAHRFKLGCREKTQCANHIVNLLGRDLEKRASVCHECCSTENCNRKLCAKGTPPTTTGPTPHSGTGTGCTDFVPDCKTLDLKTQLCSNHALAVGVCPKYCNICGQKPTCISIDPPECATLSTLSNFCANSNLVTTHKCFKTCRHCI